MNLTETIEHDRSAVWELLRQTRGLIAHGQDGQRQMEVMVRRTHELIRGSQARLARGRVDLERFRTLGCSTRVQRAYERSQAARSAERALRGVKAGA